MRDYTRWLDPALHTKVLHYSDGQGLPKEDNWVAGQDIEAPKAELDLLRPELELLKDYAPVSVDITRLLERALRAEA